MATVIAALGACLVLACSTPASAQSKAQRCEAYARDATRATPTRSNAVRGAVGGAVIGSFSGNAGSGAAIGAGVGATRRVAQKRRSYSWYYNDCMRR